MCQLGEWAKKDSTDKFQEYLIHVTGYERSNNRRKVIITNNTRLLASFTQVESQPCKSEFGFFLNEEITSQALPRPSLKHAVHLDICRVGRSCSSCILYM